MENSEYDDAKNEQALLEQRIAQLEERVRRATVVDQTTSTPTSSRSGSSSTSRTRSQATRASSDRGFRRGRSHREQAVERVADRPALMGHKRGDVVTVEVPRGPKRKLKITKIESA